MGIDAVIVLGAAVAAPGVPGGALARRLEHGVRVHRDRGAPWLLVTGGVVGPPPAEAHLMRDLAIARGVDPARIVVEDEARNTFENAVYSGRIIRERGWRAVVVVTDDFHLPRALYIFRRLGLDVEGAGAPPPPGASRLARARAHVEEWARTANCRRLFWIGAHRPVIARVWGTGGPDKKSG